MERGSGNRVKTSYKQRSPLKIPIIPLIMQGVSMIAGAANKSNKRAQEAGMKEIKGQKKFAATGGGAKTTAGAGSIGAGAEKVKPMGKI